MRDIRSGRGGGLRYDTGFLGSFRELRTGPTVSLSTTLQDRSSMTTRSDMDRCFWLT
jgi:hypothetical protein